jgi:molybdenum ABC transporter molybdate-binding protein
VKLISRFRRASPFAANAPLSIVLQVTVLLWLHPAHAAAQSDAAIRVAVAANFRVPFEALSTRFTTTTGTGIDAIYGSSGLLYAQIRQGAPYDAFLSADARRPAALRQAALTPEDPIRYATGRLALWMPGQIARPEHLRTMRFALANPLLAPYGLAARQCLETLSLWQAVSHNAVYGSNVSQTFQFVSSTGVAGGFVALAQLQATGIVLDDIWLVPQDCHEPIEQHAVALNDSPATAKFLKFLLSNETQATIIAMGYAARSDAR